MPSDEMLAVGDRMTGMRSECQTARNPVVEVVEPIDPTGVEGR
jgi:hypothetical protein